MYLFIFSFCKSKIFIVLRRFQIIHTLVNILSSRNIRGGTYTM